MARIIISHNSGIFCQGKWQSSVFYDGLIQALIDAGNDILHVISPNFTKKSWSGDNKLIPSLNKKKIHQDIKAFNPDLIITFNNSTIEGLADIVDCPYVVWDADAVQYYNDLEGLKNNTGRYHFFSFSNGHLEEIREVLNPAPDKIHRVKSATGVNPKNVPFRDNISFIGSYFQLSNHKIIKQIIDNPEIYKKLLSEYDSNKRLDVKAYIEKSGFNINIDKGEVMALRAGEVRNQVISAIAPLGLRIFGPQSWHNVIYFSLDALLSYDRRMVFSLNHNEDIYNRSKIGISIAHSQNISAYPWRVPDIMASNACLVSDYKDDIVGDFGHKVPVQLYQTPIEAHDKCKYLLENENLRRDVVAASQEVISEGYTWQIRIKEIEQILDIKLINDGQIGNYTELSSALYENPAKSAAKKMAKIGLKSIPMETMQNLYIEYQKLGINLPLSATIKNELLCHLRKEQIYNEA